jgi:hypothetical protein
MAYYTKKIALLYILLLAHKKCEIHICSQIQISYFSGPVNFYNLRTRNIVTEPRCAKFSNPLRHFAKLITKISLTP